MRRLVKSVEVENLNHHIVNHCKKMASMTEFNFITVFDGEILVTDQLILLDINESDFIRKRNNQV